MGQKKPTPTEQRDAHQGFLHPPLGRRDSRWGFRGMTVRDWLQLLIVPFALVVISFLFTSQQDQRQQQIENQRAGAERELAEQRAQDEALQAYLDQIGTLLLEKNLRSSEEDSETRTLARARTLTVLGRIDPSRKKALMQFLLEAELIQRVGGEPIISLAGADLRDIDLRGTDLSGANLEGANLEGANLSDADLSDADLSDADLITDNLTNADLSYADLGDADLMDANLMDANLSNANLEGASVSGAVNITNEELFRQTIALEGATMPNGQKFEDWLKSRGEDGENE